MRYLAWTFAGALALMAPVGLPQEPQQAPSPKLVEAGKKVYAAEGCAKCHQVDGQGNRMSPLDGVGSKLTTEELKLWLTDPDAMMAKLPRRPVVKMLKVDVEDEELAALVAYLQSLKKGD
jgi:mono/diheme cytochrome c family protein